MKQVCCLWKERGKEDCQEGRVSDSNAVLRRSWPVPRGAPKQRLEVSHDGKTSVPAGFNQWLEIALGTCGLSMIAMMNSKVGRWRLSVTCALPKSSLKRTHHYISIGLSHLQCKTTKICLLTTEPGKDKGSDRIQLSIILNFITSAIPVRKEKGKNREFI